MSDTESKHKGGRPRKDITATPEFQAAVNNAVDQATAKIIAQLATTRGGESAPAGDADQDFTRKLALAIAEISDQGTSRKRVSPEILNKRAEARERMMDLIVRAHASGERPEYRVIAKTYINEQFIEPYRSDPATKAVNPTEITWSGIPNECMRPINEIAKKIFTEFMAAIGGVTLENAKSSGGPMSVTPGGLTIKGQLNNRRQVANIADSNNGTPFDDALGIKNVHDPRATDVHVLGTVHPPAKQNFNGEARAS